MKLRAKNGDVILSASDGVLKSTVDAVLGHDRESGARLLGCEPDGSCLINVISFAVSRGSKHVLIDAGSGNGVQPTLGRLPQALAAEGITPPHVSYVFLTHLHPDHAAGLLNGYGAAAFENAEIVLHETEYEFWTSDIYVQSEKLKMTRLRNKQILSKYSDRIICVRDGTDIVGFHAVWAGGHTPGHTCWGFDVGVERYLAWGDTVHFAPIQIPNTRVGVIYDIDAEKAADSRLRILELATSEERIVLAAHVNDTGIGRITRSSDQFAWRAVTAEEVGTDKP